MAPRRGRDRCTSRRTVAVLGLFACAGWALACGGSPRPPSLADSGALGSDSTPDGDHDAGVALDAGGRDHATPRIEWSADERFIGFISDQVLTPTALPNAVHTYVYSFCAGR